jgi:uncharacterized damage-inducible protein DinB
MILFNFNRWANNKIIDLSRTIDNELFTHQIRSSYPSIRDTLTHILWAEKLWLRRWQGESPKFSFNPGDFPTINAIRTEWQDIEKSQLIFMESLRERDINRKISYENQKGELWEYPLWQMMCHDFNHSTYHRGQIATVFRQLDFPPVTTDFLVYIDEIS